MPENNQNIDIRSEQVQEILTYVPNWMIRWGMTLVFCIIVGLLFISWFIKYPDIISTEIMVTTIVPPEKIYARSSGQFDILLVNDNDVVKQDQILGIVENSANYKDVILLKSILDTISINSKSFSFPIESIPMLMLGDIAIDYALFENNYTDYFLNKVLNPFSNEFAANKMSVSQAKQRLNVLMHQQQLNNKEILIKEKKLQRQKKLFDKGVISEQTYEIKQLEWLQSKKNTEGLRSQVSQLKETIGNSRKNLKSTEIKRTLKETRLFKNVVQSFLQLRKAIKTWELKYAIKPSIDGKVSFLSFWNENQTINQGENIFTIIPSNRGAYIGKIKAPTFNSGKIKFGQKVNIRLENYPAIEFGTLEGIVKNISLIPDDKGFYLIDVELDESLITTYNQTIEFKQEMHGTAKIVTQDLRLIERFFYQMRDVFKR
jgi:multidrug resistance efflux pump